MRVVFMGTPDFSATILSNLAQHHDVVAVYTRPDAVRGRGKTLEPSPVKKVAEHYGITVCTPRTLRNEEVQQELAAFAPDIICVAAYGVILPKAVLDVPQYGCLNVHASLLPRWRGAAPIEHAILAGDRKAGVCIMRMEEGLDTGAYCVCRAADIADKNTTELTGELADLGSQALLTALVHVERDAVDWIEQDSEQVTYASKIEKGELDLAPVDKTSVLCRKVQASSAAHPSRAMVAGRSVTVLALQAAGDQAAEITAGEVRFVEKRLFLGAFDGAVEIVLLKPDGKQAMDAKSFAAGVQGIKNNTVTWEEPHA